MDPGCDRGESANAWSNLEALCRSCHRRETNEAQRRRRIGAGGPLSHRGQGRAHARPEPETEATRGVPRPDRATNLYVARRREQVAATPTLEEALARRRFVVQHFP
jgi:hypothetical protein